MIDGFFLKWWKWPNNDCGGVCICLWMYKKIIDVYTIKWWVGWYVNCSSIKLKKSTFFTYWCRTEQYLENLKEHMAKYFPLWSFVLIILLFMIHLHVIHQHGFPHSMTEGTDKPFIWWTLVRCFSLFPLNRDVMLDNISFNLVLERFISSFKLRS